MSGYVYKGRFYRTFKGFVRDWWRDGIKEYKARWGLVIRNIIVGVFSIVDSVILLIPLFGTLWYGELRDVAYEYVISRVAPATWDVLR